MDPDVVCCLVAYRNSFWMRDLYTLVWTMVNGIISWRLSLPLYTSQFKAILSLLAICCWNQSHIHSPRLIIESRQIAESLQSVLSTFHTLNLVIVFYLFLAHHTALPISLHPVTGRIFNQSELKRDTDPSRKVITKSNCSFHLRSCIVVTLVFLTCKKKNNRKLQKQGSWFS